ncbi:hypothetical protein ACFL1R_07250 [Candidatus Latescibacterota bacterium]
MKRLFVLLLMSIILIPPQVLAQDTTSQKMTIQAGYGTVTMGGVQWQRFSFRPDIPVGNFGIGLDIELFIDDKGKISKEGWDFSNKNQAWDTIIRKIYYLRYNRPLDRFYARAGSLDDVTLGYGLVMDGYRNTLNYPADKKLGVDIALRDIGSFGIDIHAMINSVGDFKNKGAVMGVRVAARPFKPTGTYLVDKLTFGVTFARDINQFAGLKDSDDDGYPDFQDGFLDDGEKWEDSDGDGFEDGIDIDIDGDNILDTADPDIKRTDYINIEEKRNGVSVFGLDIGVPLIDSAVRLDLYGQYSQIHTGDENLDGGWGIGAPGLRLLVNRLKAQIEYRHFDGRFRPNYFDHLYEHERVTLVGNSIRTKEMNLPDEKLDGVFAGIGYNFFDMVSASVRYQNMTGDRTYQDLIGKIAIHDRILQNVPKIALAEGYFYNTYVDSDRYELFDFTENTLYGTRIGFELTPSLLIVWDTRYTFTPDGKGGLVKNRFVSIETVMTVK